MRIGLVILCVLGMLNLEGQDTICKLSGECFEAQIRAQNKFTIKYTLPEDVIGPVQSIAKKELSYVRLKDGRLDVYQSDLRVTTDTNKIYRTAEGYVYQGKEISNKEILGLVNASPYADKRRRMQSLHRKVIRNNRNRYTHAIIGIAMVPAGALPAFYYSVSGNKESVPAVVLSYVAVGSVFIGVSQFCNFNYHKRKKQLVELYNTF